jgi:hypothetical protein
LLSRLYSAWFLRKQGFQFWAQFLERTGIPMLVGKGASNEAALKTMSEKLYKAVQDAVIAIGRDEDVASIAPGGSGESFERFEKAISRRIQKLILGQTLTTEVDGKGSYAAALVHNEVKKDRRNADIKLIAVTVQRLVNALVMLNFRDRRKYLSSLWRTARESKRSGRTAMSSSARSELSSPRNTSPTNTTSNRSILPSSVPPELAWRVLRGRLTCGDIPPRRRHGLTWAHVCVRRETRQAQIHPRTGAGGGTC